MAARAASDFREAVRARPGMYLGDTGPYGLSVLLESVLDAILGGTLVRATRLDVVLGPTVVRIESDGVPASAEAIAAVLGRGVPEGPDPGPDQAWDLAIAVAACSRVAFEAGSSRVEVARYSFEFTPEEALFRAGARIDWAVASGRARDLAALFPGLRTSVVEQKTGHEATFRFPFGMADLAAHTGGLPGAPRWRFQGRWQDVDVDARSRGRTAEVRQPSRRPGLGGGPSHSVEMHVSQPPPGCRRGRPDARPVAFRAPGSCGAAPVAPTILRA